MCIRDSLDCKALAQYGSVAPDRDGGGRGGGRCSLSDQYPEGDGDVYKRQMGAEVVLVGPPTLLPDEFRLSGVKVSWFLEEEMKDADVLYLLRLQKERQQAGLLPSLKEYVHLYGLTAERLSLLRPGTMVMHPGPLNIGVEVTHEAMEKLNRSSPPGVKVSILRQVENGIIVRAAVLDYLLKGGKRVE